MRLVQEVPSDVGQVAVTAQFDQESMKVVVNLGPRRHVVRFESGIHDADSGFQAADLYLPPGGAVFA